MDPNRMLVHRDWLTRKFCVNGAPLTQMWTHMSALLDCVENEQFAGAHWDGYAYSAIDEAAGKYARHHKVRTLRALYDDVRRRGVLEPVTGWTLPDGCFEVFGGHHRALLSWLAEPSRDVPTKEASWDDYDGMDKAELTRVLQAYRDVPRHENTLKTGQCYNPCPGLKAIRPSAAWRSRLIYRNVVDCRGDKLLDLGCNDGYFGCQLMNHDFQATFVDRSKAYVKVVEEKVKPRDAAFAIMDVTDFLDDVPDGYDVVLYMDVFYHTVLERGPDEAYGQLCKALDKARERLIFVPGRWDKLATAGVCPRDVFDVVRKRCKHIRYLGKDDDPGYKREVYAVYR